MTRTLNHYDALGYAEGWNLVAQPRDTENLMSKKQNLRHQIEVAQARVLDEPYTYRVLTAKLAGLDNALNALFQNLSRPMQTEVAIPDTAEET